MGDAGRIWPSETSVRRDAESGATVRQLTDHMGHSNHAYFTNPCWYDAGRRILIASDRGNRTNFFGVDLEDGGIRQLTDLDPAHGPVGAQSISVNPVRREAYFQQGDTLWALDLESLSLRPLHRTQSGYTAGNANPTADGKYVITGRCQDLSERFPVDLGHGYVGFREIWEARPHCVLLRIPLDGGPAEEVFEDRCWLGHLNPSPTRPHLMTFCHEGPWDLVDHRIWGFDLSSRRAWKIRPTQPGETVGHEYWMDDGEHIGYHGRTAGGPVYGSVRWDGTDRLEAPFGFHSWHFHSYRLDHVAGDGDAEHPFLFLFRFRAGRFEGPKALVRHRGSFHTQRLHVHPCFSPDGTRILYTADPHGYGQVFLVDIPDWDGLPDGRTS